MMLWYLVPRSRNPSHETRGPRLNACRADSKSRMSDRFSLNLKKYVAKEEQWEEG
jgi:hypothetical protein